jgi:acetyl-CoA carboxylase biotin carboxyl carrier protein
MIKSLMTNPKPGFLFFIPYSSMFRHSSFMLRHFPLIRWLDLASKTDLPRRSALTKGARTLDPKEIKDIKAIIELMEKNDLSVFEIEKEGFRLKLQKGPTAPPPAAAPPAVKTVTGTAETTPAVPKPIESKPLNEIVSPMVGTFYRAGSPDGAPFVDVGKTVTEDTVVCIIEAMKVMNEIKAETSGVIAEVVAENGKPVQFGQVLFRVR